MFINIDENSILITKIISCSTSKNLRSDSKNKSFAHDSKVSMLYCVKNQGNNSTSTEEKSYHFYFSLSVFPGLIVSHKSLCHAKSKQWHLCSSDKGTQSAKQTQIPIRTSHRIQPSHWNCLYVWLLSCIRGINTKWVLIRLETMKLFVWGSETCQPTT